MSSSVIEWELRDPVNRVLSRVQDANLRHDPAVIGIQRELIEQMEDAERRIKIVEQEQIIAEAQAKIEDAQNYLKELRDDV
jgi:hypothetical protein